MDSVYFFEQDASNYVNELVKPVLSCFFDSDSRVRYYGCESLYNIVKVARSSVLPFFNDIFDGLSKVSIFHKLLLYGAVCVEFILWVCHHCENFYVNSHVASFSYVCTLMT